MFVAKSRQELGLSEEALKTRKHTFHGFPEKQKKKDHPFPLTKKNKRIFRFEGTKKRPSGAVYGK